MKKNLLLLTLFTLLLVPAAAETGTSGHGKNAVALDPVWLLLNTYKGSYERLMFDQVSLQVEVAYSPDFLWGLHEYNSLTYLDLIGEARYYFGHFLKDAAADVDMGEYNKQLSRIFTDGIGGLYVGVFGGYVNSVVEDGKDLTYFKAAFNGVGAGLEVGCKYIFGDSRVSFFLEPYGLLQFYTGGFTYKDSNGSTITKPVGFADGFNRNGLSGGLNMGLTF